LVLGLKVVVEETGGDPRLAGDLLHRGLHAALAAQHGGCRPDDLGAPPPADRRATARATRRRVRHRKGHERSSLLIDWAPDQHAITGNSGPARERRGAPPSLRPGSAQPSRTDFGWKARPNPPGPAWQPSTAPTSTMVGSSPVTAAT